MDDKEFTFFFAEEPKTIYKKVKHREHPAVKKYLTYNSIYNKVKRKAKILYLKYFKQTQK